MDYEKKCKARFRVGDRTYQSEEIRLPVVGWRRIDAHNCPCGEAIEGMTHTVGGCDLYKEEGGGIKEKR